MTDADAAGSGRGEATEEAATEAPEGGEAACWADLLCAECGAVRGDGHHRGCSVAQSADGSLKP